jgi:hypothetical protein
MFRYLICHSVVASPKIARHTHAALNATPTAVARRGRTCGVSVWEGGSRWSKLVKFAAIRSMISVSSVAMAKASWWNSAQQSLTDLFAVAVVRVQTAATDLFSVAIVKGQTAA